MDWYPSFFRINPRPVANNTWFWWKHSCIGHDLGQRVRIIQKRNHWADLKILSWKVSFCGFMESQERILQLDHFCSHWSIKLPMKFFAPIMRYAINILFDELGIMGKFSATMWTHTILALDTTLQIKTKIYASGIPLYHLREFSAIIARTKPWLFLYYTIFWIPFSTDESATIVRFAGGLPSMEISKQVLSV